MVSLLKRAFVKESSVRGATILLMITLVLSNILGMLRDHFLAARISTYYLDVYYAAFKIPDLVFNVLILGAMSSVFIPIFTEKISQNKKDRAFEIANKLLTAGLCFTLLSAIILYFLMPYLIPFLVPKFSTDRMNLTVKISQILMLTPILFSISYTLSGVLNSYKRFFAFSIAPLFYNLSIIIGVLYFSDRFGIVGVTWSVVCGALIHFLIQAIPAHKTGFHLHVQSFFKDPDLKRIFYLMIPRSIGLGINQITILAFTAMSSALAAGSIATYNFADNIQTVPVVVFGTSLATALFPTLSEHAALKETEKFSNYFIRAFRAIIYLMIPASIFVYLLSNQIVRLILGSGKFNIFDTGRAASTLAAFSFALIFEAVLVLLIRAFFAQKNTRLPMFASVISMIVSISSGYFFSRTELGVAGLAVGLAIGNCISVCYLWLNLKKTLVFDMRDFVKFILKTFVAAIISGVICFAAISYFGEIMNLRTFLGVLGQTVFSGAIGVAIYLVISWRLKIAELELVSKKLFAKFQPFKDEIINPE